MPNQDATDQGVRVEVVFTEQGGCMPPAMIDALKYANWRAYFPKIDPLTGGPLQPMRVSTLPDNIARVDSQGAVYVPGSVKIEVQEATITLTETTAPGVPVEISFAAAITDLANVSNNIYFEVSPPESPLYFGPPRLVSGRIIYNVYRMETGLTAPYPEVVVRGAGRLIVHPSPSPT